jgi:hypothetical protein
MCVSFYRKIDNLSFLSIGSFSFPFSSKIFQKISEMPNFVRSVQDRNKLKTKSKSPTSPASGFGESDQSIH